MAEEIKAPTEQNLSELLKVRREKLAELQAQGADPFVITKYDQTHHSSSCFGLLNFLQSYTFTITHSIKYGEFYQIL